MTQPTKSVEEYNMPSIEVDGYTWIRIVDHRALLAEEMEIAEEEMRLLVSALYDEFCETQLATEQQWNESIAPKLRRLANVIRGNDPEDVTARVYKFPRHLSDNPDTYKREGYDR